MWSLDIFIFVHIGVKATYFIFASSDSVYSMVSASFCTSQCLWDIENSQSRGGHAFPIYTVS